MNWVGGSRSRLVMKNNARKQREFFEKRKMQKKLKDLGLALPASPQGTSSGSMDMVTLFIVNQIATKKEKKDPPKVTVFGNYRGESRHKRNEPLVLPMSPCSPSQLSLVESHSQYSAQGMRKRKHVIPQEFKCRQLSPVLESAFSDNSASDYLAPIADTLSPFSSTSSASSRQGVFPLQLNHQQRSQSQAKPPNCSPSPWDTSGLEQTKFQRFSQPRGMTGDTPWSCGSYPSFYQLETPTAAQVLFGRPEPDIEVRVRGSGRPEVRFSLSQPEDKEPILDLKLNQSETEHQFEEDVFSGFSNDVCEREAFNLGSAKSKIYLQDETPVRPLTPQTVPDSQSMGGEHSNSTYMNFLYPGHNTGPMNGCECYSCREGCLSSDTDDDELVFQPCPQASASSYIHQACCTDTPNLNQCSQENPEQRLSQPRLLTPLIKPQMNLRDDQNVACPDKACETNDQQIGRSTAQFVSPHPLAQSQLVCKCKQASNETRDVGSQTVDIPTAEKRDASTQCDSVTRATAYNLYLPPVVKPVQHLATGRQTDTAAEPNTLSASSGNLRSGGKHTPWNNENSKADSLPGSSSSVKLSDDKVTIQQPIIQFADVQSIPDDRGKESGEASTKREQQENGPLMKNLSDEGKEEVTSSTRVKRLSKKAETLQEIADILLLLKQKTKEG
ncbi:uncharacterized protein redic1 isoform X2 [Mastacembelus armatus]|uniref:uncharacterized protein redic1 isoform X2 n=1 Tax=Mastacembelus armatus TaxID=205130 RepID=UPI000E45D3E4|nr:uncharacterized protein C12orf40 homolog isoform X2 [Mastacembelus armatus]